MSREICDSIIKYIRQNISRYSAVHISWFGGEPLMGMDVIEHISTEVIEICKRAKSPISVQLLQMDTYLLLKICLF